MKKLIKAVLGIILTIIIVAVAGCAIFAYTNPDLAKSAYEILKSAPGNNLKAAWIFLTDSSSISEQIDKNTESFDNAVNSVVGSENVLSPAVKEAIESGKYTEEEITRILISGEAAIAEIEKERQEASAENDTTLAPEDTDVPDTDVTVSVPDDTASDIKTPDVQQPDNPEPQKPIVSTPEVDIPPVQKPEPAPEKNPEPVVPEPKPQTPSTPAPTTAADTASYVAKLYIQKSKFMDYLGSIERLIIDEYNALPEELKIPSERKRIALAHLQTMAKMEAECDSEVEKILDELKTKLVAENKDTSVVSSLLQAYENEKSLKKAQYMDIFLNGLPKKKSAEKTEN